MSQTTTTQTTTQTTTSKDAAASKTLSLAAGATAVGRRVCYVARVATSALRSVVWLGLATLALGYAWMIVESMNGTPQLRAALKEAGRRLEHKTAMEASDEPQVVAEIHPQAVQLDAAVKNLFDDRLALQAELAKALGAAEDMEYKINGLQAQADVAGAAYLEAKRAVADAVAERDRVVEAAQAHRRSLDFLDEVTAAAVFVVEHKKHVRV
jgi:hypothetical protein